MILTRLQRRGADTFAIFAGPEPGEVLDITEGEAQLLPLLDLEPPRRTVVFWANDKGSAAQVAQFAKCAPHFLLQFKRMSLKSC